MISLKTTIDGAEQQIARMARAPSQVLDAAQDGAAQALFAMRDVLADYPPELPGQRYERTNALHDDWAEAMPVFTVMTAGFEGVMANPIGYGSEVEGDEQAAVHRDRWPTVEQVQKAQQQAARDTIAAAVRAKTGSI